MYLSVCVCVFIHMFYTLILNARVFLSFNNIERIFILVMCMNSDRRTKICVERGGVLSPTPTKILFFLSFNKTETNSDE